LSYALVALPNFDVRKGHVRSFPRFITGLQRGFTSLSRKFLSTLTIKDRSLLIFRGTFIPVHPCAGLELENTSFVKEKR
jgi:hypothetical protein